VPGVPRVGDSARELVIDFIATRCFADDLVNGGDEL